MLCSYCGSKYVDLHINKIDYFCNEHCARDWWISLPQSVRSSYGKSKTWDTGNFKIEIYSTPKQYHIGFNINSASGTDKGNNKENPNEDRYSSYISDDKKIYCFGIFDGHAGSEVSDLVSGSKDKKYDMVKEVALSYIKSKREKTDIKKSISDTFLTWDSEKIPEYYQRNRDSFNRSIQLRFKSSGKKMFDLPISGSTATIVIIDTEKNLMYTSYVGDSQYLYYRPSYKSKSGKSVRSELFLSGKHDDENKEEVERVKAAGGIFHNEYFRIKKDGPGLAMSRSLGDYYFKRKVKTTFFNTSHIYDPSGIVSCYPEIIDPIDITNPVTRYIIIASDGLWDATEKEGIRKGLDFFKGDDDLGKFESALRRTGQKLRQEIFGDTDDTTVTVIKIS